MTAFLHHLGLVLLGGVFFWVGVEHFLRFRVIAASLAERGFPAPRPLLAAGSVLEIVAGFCLATGIGAAYAAAALAVFTIAATAMALNFWRYTGDERAALRSGFTINVAVLGGLIVAATAGLQ
ncbi:DoxX family membrane protein [Chelativorans alearense]|uniref:DoxX family membrane protein n=1 Tax=Chelativorans alearense TaxID=2681495 RepID=UPI0013D07CE9|nr:DoxX family membrane protein [Chelativorans alearense]